MDSDRLADLLNRLPTRHARWLAATIVAVSVASLPAAAQSAAEEAAGAAGDAGLCSILTLVIGFIVLLLVVLAGVRGGLAWKNLGAASPEKKRDGRSQLVGAGTTFVGVFFFAVFGYALSTAGLTGVSCVDWGSVIVAAF